MDYSIKRLTAEQKLVLHACSLFLAPFPSEFVESLLEEEEQTQDILHALVSLGLLERKLRTFPEGTLVLLELHAMTR